MLKGEEKHDKAKANTTPDPVVKLSARQMIGIFLVCLIIGIVLFFFQSVLGSALISLSIAVALFGFLGASGAVEKETVKVGGSLAGFVVAFWLLMHYIQPTATKSTSPESDFPSVTTIRQRLFDGYTPRTAIRLISRQAFDEAGGENGAKLGSTNKAYVFVGDYEELKGHTVGDALNRLGIANDGNSYTTPETFVVVIFDPEKNPDTDLCPGSARGFLKAMHRIAYEKSRPSWKFYDDLINSDPLVRDNLTKSDAESYGIGNWGALLHNFDALLSDGVKTNEPFKSDFGEIDQDWTPYGFSTDQAHRGPDLLVLGVPIQSYGALIFLSRNEAVKSLPGRNVLYRQKNETIP